MPSDKSWVETVHQIRTDDSFYYEVGPDPDGLGLELRYIEIAPDSKATKVHSRVGFSEQLAMIIGPAIVRAGQDYIANEEK